MCEKLCPLVFFFKSLCPITGPVGPPGSPGIEGPRGVKGELGPRGEKGDAGSFDFFMLMMADLRHDLEQLQARVFPSARDSNRAIPRYVKLNKFHIKVLLQFWSKFFRYNMQQHMAWEKQMREKHANSALNDQQPLLYSNEDNLILPQNDE